MRIALLGYGKIGREIEKAALARQHEIVHIIRSTNSHELKEMTPEAVDVVIEFTQPDTAFANIKTCIENGLPIVSGTTGWLEFKPQIEQLIHQHNGSFFYASNYSIGVHLFFHFNRIMAEMMNGFPAYDVEMEEIHHVYKKDSPSGTALTAAEDLLARIARKTEWQLNTSDNKNTLRIVDKRISAVPGKHAVLYHSPIDSIELTHTAHNREGFAAGAVVAAEFIQGKKGLFGMNDLLGF